MLIVVCIHVVTFLHLFVVVEELFHVVTFLHLFVVVEELFHVVTFLHLFVVVEEFFSLLLCHLPLVYMLLLFYMYSSDYV